jgi:hypothetical protein
LYSDLEEGRRSVLAAQATSGRLKGVCTLGFDVERLPKILETQHQRVYEEGTRGRREDRTAPGYTVVDGGTGCEAGLRAMTDIAALRVQQLAAEIRDQSR